MKSSHHNPQNFSFSFFFFLLTIAANPCLCSNTNTTISDFINTSCNATLYPKPCCKILTPFANTIQTSPMNIACVALNVSLKSAQSASKDVLKLSKRRMLSHRDAGAIRDCIETLGDSIYEIKKSIAALNDLQRPDFEFQMSNIQTWVSAALTDESTCMDGFEGKSKNVDEHIKGVINKCIKKVAQITSISLALINKITST